MSTHEEYFASLNTGPFNTFTLEKPDVSCLTCFKFTSFREDYCDNMEPDDQGFCGESKSHYCGNNGAGAYVCCQFYDKSPLKL